MRQWYYVNIIVIFFSLQGLYNYLLVGLPINLWKFKSWLYSFCGLCRCECFGHALTYRNIEGTGGQLGRCVCDCHPSTNTEGENVCASTLDNNYFDICQVLYLNE